MRSAGWLSMPRPIPPLSHSHCFGLKNELPKRYFSVWRLLGGGAGGATAAGGLAEA